MKEKSTRATTMAEPKTPEQYLQEPYAIKLIRDSESGVYTAQIEEFPGCFAEGKTLEEAYTNLQTAAVSWLEAALDMGQVIPEPYVNRTYSGNIALRLPKSLHADVVRAAEREGTSLNKFLVATIAEKIGATTEQTRNERIAAIYDVSDLGNVRGLISSSLAAMRSQVVALSDEIKADTMKEAFIYKVFKSHGTRSHGR